MSSTTSIAFLVASVLMVPAVGCGPEVPAAPTYTRDVQPILAAHCVRCHDAAFTPVRDPISGTDKVPVLCHLDTFDDTGDCRAAGMTARQCRFGAKTCAGMLHGRMTSDVDTFRMPKPPSDPLNDWEVDVLDHWAANPLQ